MYDQSWNSTRARTLIELVSVPAPNFPRRLPIARLGAFRFVVRAEMIEFRFCSFWVPTGAPLGGVEFGRADTPLARQ